MRSRRPDFRGTLSVQRSLLINVELDCRGCGQAAMGCGESKYEAFLQEWLRDVSSERLI